MKCSSMKTINKLRFNGHTQWVIFVIFYRATTFIRQQVSYIPVEGDHYNQVKLQLSFSIITSTFHAYFWA